MLWQSIFLNSAVISSKPLPPRGGAEGEDKTFNRPAGLHWLRVMGSCKWEEILAYIEDRTWDIVILFISGSQKMV